MTATEMAIRGLIYTYLLLLFPVIMACAILAGLLWCCGLLLGSHRR